MIDPQAAQMLKEAIGITDEDLARVGDRVKRIMGMAPTLSQYQIVAEVTQAKYCFGGIKQGHKIVFNCFPIRLNTEESDCPLCVRALGPVLEPVIILRELLMAGIDPAQIPQRGAECLDPGLEAGGLGHVSFKVSLHKKT